MRVEELRVIEDLEAGGTRDETQRLRFILDTIGKKTWPGEQVPAAWAELVRRHNDKAAEEEGDATPGAPGAARVRSGRGQALAR